MFTLSPLKGRDLHFKSLFLSSLRFKSILYSVCNLILPFPPFTLGTSFDFSRLRFSPMRYPANVNPLVNWPPIACLQYLPRRKAVQPVKAHRVSRFSQWRETWAETGLRLPSAPLPVLMHCGRHNYAECSLETFV